MNTSPSVRLCIAPPEAGGAMYLGPGDVYRFLVTGADTAGAYFAMEAIVGPGAAHRPTSIA
jgi:hypothetical protein